MDMSIAKKYCEGLRLSQEDRLEVENVITGYMAECEHKDRRIGKLEKGLTQIIERFEEKLPQHKEDCFAFQVAKKALSDV